MKNYNLHLPMIVIKQNCGVIYSTLTYYLHRVCSQSTLRRNGRKTVIIIFLR